MSKEIEIFIACHKPSELPANDYFVPIHVGAKNSKITLPDLQRDDEGDNISEKNPTYCELTAQYWAWKHSHADYIGLCHYRRYLSFSPKTFTNLTPNHRKQVFVSVLTPETEAKYGLLDKEQMKKVIESSDVLVCQAQDLSLVSTPYGPQKTTLKHWMAHHMALINVYDLNEMFDIVKHDYPDIFQSMSEYMNDKYFYGFNTFVFRRDLFCEMCKFEFDVLSKLEKRVNIEHYNQQLSRIFGFMGEILFSSFVYHLKKTRKDIKVAERQMLYFDQTDPIKDIQPQYTSSEKIVIDLTGAPAFVLYPCLTTLLKNLNKEQSYEIIVLTDKIDKFYTKYYTRINSIYKNVSLKFKNVSFFMSYLNEMIGPAIYYSSNFVAWLLPKFDRCLYLKWNTFINAPIDELYNLDLQGKWVAASRDIYYEGKLNTFYQEDYNYATKNLGIHNKFEVISEAVTVMDLIEIRKQDLFSVAKKIRSLYYDDNGKPIDREPNEVECFNMMYNNKAKIIGQAYNHLYITDGDIQFYVKEASLELNNQYNIAANETCIQRYDVDAPWYVDLDIEFYLRYWNCVKQSDLEEIFRHHLVIRNQKMYSARNIGWSVVNTLLPKKTKRREFIKKVFPKNGKIYQHLKKAIRAQDKKRKKSI